MPYYDVKCTVETCSYTKIDVFEPIECPSRAPCPLCGALVHRAWLTRPPVVIGDAIDVTIRHGLTNPDGSPQHFTSKSEIRREAKRRGLENVVRHVGAPGSDRSKHTTRWT